MNNKYGCYEIPFSYGLQVRVVLGGLVAGSCRSLIETPLEYAKVWVYFEVIQEIFFVYVCLVK